MASSLLSEVILSDDDDDDTSGDEAEEREIDPRQVDIVHPAESSSGDDTEKEEEKESDSTGASTSDENNSGDSEIEGAEIDLDLERSCLPSVSGVESVAKSFIEFGIGAWLSNQLESLAIKRPTPVQANCIPHILAGRDVLGCAKTGTGKTLAFALPILHELAIDPFGIFALVLTPTRELAFQIAEQFSALGKQINLKTAVIVGGRDMIAQALDLAGHPHIVAATPGRLKDHIESYREEMGQAFARIRFLVLDEADRILDGQYAPQLKEIFSILPKKRQTLLFSATITSALTQLRQVSVKKPYFFQDKSDVATVDQLEQKYVLCPRAVKDAYLVYVVKNFYTRRENSLILVFSHTCRECQALAMMFNGLGFQVGSLHSQISQKERLSSLTRFRSGRIRILICTDVAARGLDIPHVDLVINHNIPRCPKTYVHRVGRSARAGRFGGAITFITQYDIVLLQEVEKLIGKKLEKLNVNDKKVTQYVTQVLVAKREAEIKLEHQSFGERKEINKRKEMILAGLSPEEVDQAFRERRKRQMKVPGRTEERETNSKQPRNEGMTKKKR